VTWWKSISIPTRDGKYFELEAHNGHTLQLEDLDFNRPLRFSKAKKLGAHTLLGFTWPVPAALSGRNRVILNWDKDHC
jgi:hypothetical protein